LSAELYPSIDNISPVALGRALQVRDRGFRDDRAIAIMKVGAWPSATEEFGFDQKAEIATIRAVSLASCCREVLLSASLTIVSVLACRAAVARNSRRADGSRGKSLARSRQPYDSTPPTDIINIWHCTAGGNRV